MELFFSIQISLNYIPGGHRFTAIVSCEGRVAGFRGSWWKLGV